MDLFTCLTDRNWNEIEHANMGVRWLQLVKEYIREGWPMIYFCLKMELRQAQGNLLQRTSCLDAINSAL